MEFEYLELFGKFREMSSEDFLKEKKKLEFFNVKEYSDDQAFMNYRMDGTIYEQFMCMYEGYAETSLHLLEDCMKNKSRNKKDIWMFPIFFNTIHALELFLKATNYLLLMMESNFEEDIDITAGGHNILQLSSVVKAKIQVSEQFSIFKDDFKLIHTFIEMIAEMFKIDTVDKDTFVAPRYPITKNKIPYKYAEKAKKIAGTDFYEYDNFTIKMSILRIWLLKVNQICEDFNMYVQDYFESLSDG